MAETISVRIPKREVKEINEISKLEKRKKSEVLREILNKGMIEKRIEFALEKYRNKEVTATKAANIAHMPLSQFLDILVQKGLEFHYGLKELREDFEGLI